MTLTGVIPDQCDSEEGSSPATSALHGSPGASRRRHTLSVGAFSLIDQALVSATNFTTTLILARLCSQAELGVYYLAWTLILFTTAMQSNLVSVPYTIYSPRHEGESLHSYFGSALVHQLATSLLAVLCLLVLIAVVSLGIAPASLRPVAFVLLIAAPLISFREFVRRLAFAHLRMKAALGVDILVTTVQLGGLAILAYFGALSVPAVYGVMGIACAVASASWFLFSRRPVRFVPSRIVSDWRQNWSFAKWALACQFTGLCYHALPWLLMFAHGTAAAGVLAASNALVGPANLFVIGLCNFLTPKVNQAFAAEGPSGLARVLRKASLVFAVTLVPFCLLALMAGGLVAQVAYGPKYAGIGPVIAVLALGIALDGFGLAASNGLWAMDRPSANFAADATQMAVMLGTGMCLVTGLGVLGIAIAIVTGRTVGTVIRWITLCGLMKTRELELEPA